MKRYLVLLSAFTLLIIFYSCKKEVLLRSISLETAVLKIKLEDTVKIKIITVPADATIESIKWSIGDEQIAFISDDGAIIPKKIGKTHLSVVVNNSFTDNCELTILNNNYIIIGNKDYGISKAYLYNWGQYPSTSIPYYELYLDCTPILVTSSFKILTNETIEGTYYFNPEIERGNLISGRYGVGSSFYPFDFGLVTLSHLNWNNYEITFKVEHKGTNIEGYYKGNVVNIDNSK